VLQNENTNCFMKRYPSQKYWQRREAKGWRGTLGEIEKNYEWSIFFSFLTLKSNQTWLRNNNLPLNRKTNERWMRYREIKKKKLHSLLPCSFPLEPQMARMVERKLGSAREKRSTTLWNVHGIYRRSKLIDC